MLKLLATILGLDDPQRRRLERGSHRLFSGGSSWGLLFRAPGLGWEAITEAEIGEQWVQVSLLSFRYLVVLPSEPLYVTSGHLHAPTSEVVESDNLQLLGIASVTCLETHGGSRYETLSPYCDVVPAAFCCLSHCLRFLVF